MTETHSFQQGEPPKCSICGAELKEKAQIQTSKTEANGYYEVLTVSQCPLCKDITIL